MADEQTRVRVRRALEVIRDCFGDVRVDEVIHLSREGRQFVAVNVWDRSARERLHILIPGRSLDREGDQQ